MLKSGDSFMGYFLTGAAFIPLVPVILTFIRKSYGKEPLNFLAIICLLGFLQELISIAPSGSSENQAIIHNVFSFFLFGLFAHLFKTSLPSFQRYLLNIFLAAFLSSVITYGAIKGWGFGHFPLD